MNGEHMQSFKEEKEHKFQVIITRMDLSKVLA